MSNDKEYTCDICGKKQLQGKRQESQTFGPYFDCSRCRASLPIIDDIRSPIHYPRTKHDWCEVAEDWQLPGRLWNVLKYLRRYKLKGKPVKDLKKAQQYIEMEIQAMGKRAVEQVTSREARTARNIAMDMAIDNIMQRLEKDILGYALGSSTERQQRRDEFGLHLRACLTELLLTSSSYISSPSLTDVPPERSPGESGQDRR